MVKRSRSLKVIKEAFSRVDLSPRGSDEEYTRAVEEEAKAFELYRKRAEARLKTLEEVMKDFGITQEDLEAAGDVEIESE